MYTRKVLDSIAGKNWGAVLGSLFAINALLPKEYQVAFSTREYNKKIQNNIICKCLKCKKKIDFKKVKIIEITTPVLDEFLTGNYIMKIWVCPLCKQDNKLSNTEIVKTKIQEPFYFKIVPNPPERKDGLADLRTYDKKMQQWAWTCVGELEKQMSEFRKDNWKQQDGGFNDVDIDTSIEEGKELVTN
jgi:hypothetical protein